MKRLTAKLLAAFDAARSRHIRRKLAVHQEDILRELRSHARRELRSARWHARAARARRIYAAWLDSQNAGWHRERPANVTPVPGAHREPIQFPRLSTAIGGLHLVRKGAAQ